jgi:hypothetical protein
MRDIFREAYAPLAPEGGDPSRKDFEVGGRKLVVRRLREFRRRIGM